MKRTFSITCHAAEYLPYQQIKDFQGDLKTRTVDDIDHLVYSIETYGFSFPFYIWRQPDGTCSCLDGHGRLLALTKMEQNGYEIPELPVVYIDAENEADARTKLIQINTQTGSYTETGMRELVRDLPQINLAEYSFPGIDLNRVQFEIGILRSAEESIMSTGLPAPDTDIVDSTALPPIPTRPLGSLATTPEPFNVTGNDNPPTFVTEGIQVPETQDPMPVVDEVSPDTDTLQKTDEMMICCANCGKNFVYRYNTDTNTENK